MARNWVRLPSYSSKEEAERYVPPGWEVFQIEDLYDQLPVGKRFEQKTSFPIGTVPVIDQSESGIVGYHNEDPGVTASPENPVVTFANHTCEMRMMTEPFSVIQNVFPLIGRAGVCRTKFFYYLTKGRVWLEEYKGHFPEFRRKWVCCPPEVDQERLEKILCSFDSKIDLNRRINQTLEAMAQAIFKSWFVDFDPVKAKIAAIEQGQDPLRAAMRAISGKTDAELDQMPREHHDQLAATAALFPDAMEESELGDIPKGWRISKVSEFAVLVGGRQLEREHISNSGNFPVFGGAGIMGYTENYNADGFVISVGRVGAYCGQFFSHRGKAWINNNASLIQQRDERLGEWLFISLKHADIEVIKKGAAQPFVSNGDIANLPLLWSNEDTITAFTRQISSIFRSQEANSQQSQALAQLRDTLLPKLLSGELSVAPLEKQGALP